MRKQKPNPELVQRFVRLIEGRSHTSVRLALSHLDPINDWSAELVTKAAEDLVRELDKQGMEARNLRRALDDQRETRWKFQQGEEQRLYVEAFEEALKVAGWELAPRRGRHA